MKPGLSSAEMMKAYESNCLGIADDVFQTWANSPDGVVPLFQSFSNLTYAYVFTMFLGKSFCLKHAQEAITRMTDVLEALQSPLLQALPHNLWTLIPAGNKALRSQQWLVDAIRGVAVEIFEGKKKGLSMDDTYLGFLCQNSTEEFITNISYHVQLMMFAAHLNVSSTIPWLLLHANHVPGCLERCREELETRDVPGGRGTLPPYLEACLRETGRLYTATVLLRKIPDSHPKGHITLLGHLIPSGTIVANSPLVTQQDPLIFENPEEWDPERFLANEGENYKAWFNRMEFLQFGAGMRSCLGEKMTRSLLVNDFMGVLLRKYDIQVVGGLQEGIGYSGVGVVPAWSKRSNATPPQLGARAAAATAAGRVCAERVRGANRTTSSDKAAAQLTGLATDTLGSATVCFSFRPSFSSSTARA